MWLKGSKTFLVKSLSTKLPLRGKKRKKKETNRKSEVKKIQNQESIFNLWDYSSVYSSQLLADITTGVAEGCLCLVFTMLPFV